MGIISILAMSNDFFDEIGAMSVNKFENKYNLLKHIGSIKAELELVSDLKYLPLIFGVWFLNLGILTPQF